MPFVASKPLPNERDLQLRERAAKVVPGGMTGHLNAASLASGYSQFFERGGGCRVWDVGCGMSMATRSSISCAAGAPNLLGHHYQGADAAARRQQNLGDCLNGPTSRFVELA